MADPVTIGLIATAASTAFSVVGGLKDAAAVKAQGEAQNRINVMQAEQARVVSERNAMMLEDQKNREALQAEAAGKSAAATGQRAAIEAKRKMALTQSRAQALQAASGAGALDPTALNITGQIEGEGQYDILSQLYSGETEARSYQTAADLARYEGKTGAEMTRYGGATQADLLTYQGKVASAEGKQKSQSIKTKTIASAAGDLGGGLMSKYSSGAYKPVTEKIPVGAYGGGYGNYGNLGRIDWYK